MSDLPQRTIDDLRARYEFEPTLNDLYVEGSFDKEVVERVILLTNSTFRGVYEIDTVNVPTELVEKHKLTSGNKQRVIVLARELASIEQPCSYRCLVDRDLDHWFGVLESTANLAWTAHTSIELYFLSREFLKEILVVTAKCNISDWEKFYGSFITTLRIQYAMRLTDRSLDLRMKWVQVDKSLSLKDGAISFDLREYVKKLLLANGKHKNQTAFDNKLSEWTEKLGNDPRSHIRGHDLISLMAWCVQAFKGIKSYSNEESISRLFVLLSDTAAEIMLAIG